MTFLKKFAFGGESKDSQAEVRDNLAASACVVDTTAAYIAAGNGTVKFPMNTSATPGTKCMVKVRDSSGAGTFGASSIQVFSFSGGLSAQPTSAVGWLSDGTQAGPRFVTFGNASDTKVRVLDKNGTVWATSSTSMATVGNTRVTVMFDYLNTGGNVSTNPVYIVIYVNGVVEAAVQSNLSSTNFFGTADIYFGEWLPDATARGADLYGKSYPRGSSTASDALFITQYPDDLTLVGGGSLPATSEGNYTAWTGSPDTTPNTWKDIGATRDFLPGNDGVGSYIGPGGVNSIKSSYNYAAANPVPVGGIIDDVQMRCAFTLVAAGKTACGFFVRNGGADNSTINPAAPGTSYVGDGMSAITRPSGSWVKADFEPGTTEFGVESSPSGTVSVRVTELMLDVIYYTTLLPLCPPPPNLLDEIWVPTNQPQFPQVRVVGF